jgi:hypothetical protein
MTGTRREVLDLLRATADRFRVETARVPDELWKVEPGDGAWSPELIAEHLALVEVSTARLMARKLFEAPAPADLLAETRGQEAILRRALPDRSRQARSPDFVAPSGRWVRRDDIVGAFAEARAQVMEHLADESRNLGAHAWPHPIFGPLDGWQWGLFLALHVERHLAQLEQVVDRLAGGPGAP